MCFGFIRPARGNEFCMPSISADYKRLKDNDFHLRYIFHLVNKAYNIKNSDYFIVFLLLPTSLEIPLM